MDFNAAALLHNLNQVKRSAPHQKIMAIVKANAYGCGIENVVPVLEGHVDAFGVAALEEAKAIRRLGSRTDLVLLEGAFSKDELGDISTAGFQCVVHCKQQLLDVLDAKATSKKIKIWIKVDTGMHRLGFLPTEVAEVVLALKACAWVEPILGLMTHFASADELGHFSCPLQLQQFSELDILGDGFIRSLSNSAAILSLPQAHADVVRPGIMLYGVSPFFDKVGADFGLVPVMRFVSAISAIHHYPPHSPIGYGGDWVSDSCWLWRWISKTYLLRNTGLGEWFDCTDCWTCFNGYDDGRFDFVY